MRSPRRFRTFLILALLLVPLLSACDDTALLEELVDMGRMWGQENGILNEDDSIDWFGVAAHETQKIVKGTTGDSTLDAVLTAGPTVYTFHQADQSAQRGLEEGNVALIDAAITMRPDDWSYYDKKAAVLAAQGTGDAQLEFQKADLLVSERIIAGGDCKALKLNLYRNREAALLTQLASNEGNEALLDMLDETQSQIYYLESNHENSPCP